MEFLKYIFYGIIQGLTEFIPVSSTAHLKIISLFFGMDDPGSSVSAIIQIGSVFAIFWYFRKSISNFIIPPIKTIGIEPIKIDLYNLLDKNEYISLLEVVFLILKILFLKYQNIAKTLPICMIADKEDPGSLIPNNRDMIFKWAVLLTGINSVKPWIIP